MRSETLDVKKNESGNPIKGRSNVTCIVTVLVIRSIRRVIAVNTKHLILKVCQREKHAFLSMKLTANEVNYAKRYVSRRQGKKCKKRATFDRNLNALCFLLLTKYSAPLLIDFLSVTWQDIAAFHIKLCSISVTVTLHIVFLR